LILTFLPEDFFFLASFLAGFVLRMPESTIVAVYRAIVFEPRDRMFAARFHQKSGAKRQ
jgi:hypothetical protein